MSPSSDKSLLERLVQAQTTISDLQMELQDTNKGLIALTIELEDNLEEGRAETERLRTLNLLTQKISATLELDEVLQFVVQATADLLSVPYVGAFILKDDKLKIRAEFGDYYSRIGHMEFGIGEGHVGRVASAGEIIYVRDAQNDPQWNFVEIARKEGLHSCLGVPLKQGEVVQGVLNCMDIKIREFGEGEMDLISAFAHVVEIAIQNASRYEEIQVLQRMTESIAHTVTDSVLDGIITIDTGGSIKSFNPAAERLFGFSIEEVIGKNVVMLMSKPDSERHETQITNYLSTGETHILGTGREVQGLRKDGSTFPLYLAVSEGRVGDERFFTGVLHDLTDQKKAEEAMKTQLEELERFNKMAVGRELRIIELKETINDLMGELGREPAYKAV